MDRRVQPPHSPEVVDLALHVPVRVQRLRVDLAKAEVIAQPHQAVGQQQVEVGGQPGRRGAFSRRQPLLQRLQRREVIIRRHQTFLVDGPDGGEQLIDGSRIRPQRGVVMVFIQSGQHDPGGERFTRDRQGLAVPEGLDAGGDGLLHRRILGGGRGEGEQPQQQA